MNYLIFADDDKNMQRMVRDMLVSVGYSVDVAGSGEAALQLVRERTPDLLILDVHMPGLSGLDVCRVLKGNERTAGIPILLLTGKSAVEARVAGFEAGADEYLPKPFDARELRARVAALLRLVRRESDRNPTSGLPGAVAIEDQVKVLVADGRRFVVCYVDIDNFKAFADNFGFGAANDVIRGAAQALRTAVENHGASGDFVGHIGGDDFVVLTHETSSVAVARAASSEFAEVLRKAVGPQAADTGRFLGRDREGVMRWLPLSRLSVAILAVDPAAWVSTEHLGERAAELKRRAKLKGPGTILLDVG